MRIEVIPAVFRHVGVHVVNSRLANRDAIRPLHEGRAGAIIDGEWLDSRNKLLLEVEQFLCGFHRDASQPEIFVGDVVVTGYRHFLRLRLRAPDHARDRGKDLFEIGCTHEPL